ncbi:NADPH-dependent FMN reductase domain protein [Lysobacter enzymogenes]|uniref:FMN dependent NADH:quinone oxidoreductase n=1 Tax=Lysobacter enzymogenes TaxID=69 RepID=A0A0S2DI18_LYSEN|nr:NAD(P)H-dependent oxidoreductase [Lysobacter enzymogenes]ALN58310.1 NADPH-dependent FMN reductase domain protein [Lysobacter enzymogenes]QCW26729.1 FMN-dependent NADH-azoreductase [Lysobacter enzymogenes]
MNILHIDSSILGDQSVSRKLSAAIVSKLRALAPGADVVYRDLNSEPLPALTTANAAALDPAAPADNDEVRALNAALAQVLAADAIVVGAPMYNFSIPAPLKAWLDALAVPGKTFGYENGAPKGLLGAKRVIVASSRGGVYAPQTPMAALEHHENYLRAFFGFLGVTQLEFVRAEGLKMGPEQAERAVAGALEQVEQLRAA